MAGSSVSFKSLNDPGDLLRFLGVVGEPSLYVISVDWVGCGACGTPDSPYIALRDSLAARYSERDAPAPRFGVIDWRLADKFGEPVIQSYKLFLYLTRTKRQLLGGGRPVETFTDLDEAANWRPKFPQLFFMDGRKIDLDALESLLSDDIFHKYFESLLSLNPLLGHDDQIVNSDKIKESTNRVLSGDLRLESHDLLGRLSGCIDPDNGILMQLTNFNMYKADGDNPEDFMKDAIYRSSDCAIERFYAGELEPADCVDFDRRNTECERGSLGDPSLNRVRTAIADRPPHTT